jgi:hypothetical protein
MEHSKNIVKRFVICIDNTEYPASLELHKVYQCIPDVTAEHDGDVRIIDESGEDYLYPAAYFLELPPLPDDAEHVLQESFSLERSHVA